MAEKIKVTLELHLEYCCSKCKARNIHVEKVTGLALKADGSAAQKEENARACKSAKYISGKLGNLLMKDPADRYVRAGFSCRCEKCGHQEPWARMRYGVLWIIGMVGTLAFVCATAAEMILPAGNFRFLQVLGLMVLAASLVAKPLHLKQMRKQIAELPKESLPLIYQTHQGNVMVWAPDPYEDSRKKSNRV